MGMKYVRMVVNSLHDAFEVIGQGQPLRIPHDGSPACFANFRPEHEAIAAPPEIVKALLASGQLHKLSEFGEPPIQERRGQGWRNGWRELGWPSDSDWYVMVQ